MTFVSPMWSPSGGVGGATHECREDPLCQLNDRLLVLGMLPCKVVELVADSS